jgi:hypothetical protein
MCKSSRSSLRLRWSLLMKLKSCGHRTVTECPKTTSQQNYIRVLYGEGILAISKSIGSMEPNRRLANENQANGDISSFSSRPQPSQNDNGRDIALQSKASSSSFKPVDESGASQLSLRNQGRKGKKNDPVIRFLYMCCPSSRGRGLREVTVRSDDNVPRDGMLIKDLKRWYYSQRTFLQRLKTLRDISTIRLQRVSARVF